ncbi:ATP-binding protein [Neobittarella massiliensis]|uniref:ATP-binding protein n=1 Tax=Neobittarella massiliensis (ex Bilen et al. 2018) TaxID=2041842 RepID=A0A8J6INY1_9FIRM|nr:AAA family ATPase [Neobittarella massiliensis]MBC3515213.1 ATP-binding protein [Neobittarella massiliensis]
MSYALSQLDKDNLRWFSHDKSRNSLVGLEIDNGNIRGVFPCKIDFTYPISAFVGENGSGKSTILALAACAFHNDDTFHQFARKKSYFTYGDFFTFSPEETGLQGIEITYTIRQTDGDIPNLRKKKPSGKWNDFNTRKSRNVIYLGINRIVPPSESSAHRSYRKAFETEAIPPIILDQIKTLAGRIFGKNYSSLRIFSHNSYRLFLVERNEISYSGFNMGAGENAVISILLELLIAGSGSLLVIDEIELGLHAKAQREFIKILKEICYKNKCQVICSTHSDIVLSCIPPEARFFIQNQNAQTNITQGISAEYAFGKLAGQNTHELDVFVEDEVGKSVIINLLPLHIRERLEVYVIGSDQAILKQMAARYREEKMNFISFLDGDKRTAHDEQIRQIRNHLETRIDDEGTFQRIIGAKICYIPGDTWPEMSILQYLLKAPNLEGLVERWDISAEDVTSFLEQALAVGKHKEFFHLAKLLSMDEFSVRNDCIKSFKSQYPDECNIVCELISAAIKSL